MTSYRIRVSVDEAFPDVGDFDMDVNVPDGMDAVEFIDGYLEFIMEDGVYMHSSFEFI